MKLKPIYYPALFCVLCATGMRAQQVQPRIAGLESNAEYMQLLSDETALRGREDSLLRVVDHTRRSFAERAAGRDSVASLILRLEEEVFALRNRMGRLSDRINGIEQEWLIANLANLPDEGSQSEEVLAAVDSLPASSDLVRNAHFERLLSPSDYQALLGAQGRELKAVECVNRYLDNYLQLAQLEKEYAEATDAETAAPLFERFGVLRNINGAVADSLASDWSYIFDNKLFAYNYLLDKLNRTDLLRETEARIGAARQRYAEARGEYVSDELAAYCIQKEVMLGCEQMLAELFGLEAARDSLQNVAAQLRSVAYDLPRIEIEERYFLAYEPIGVSSPSKYTARNPIPDCQIYERGEMYRVLLGTFSLPQQPGIFRGVYPLSKERDEAGKIRYYAGGFATEAEALQAQERLRKMGFRRPEVVVWRDGVYANLSREPAVAPQEGEEGNVQLYRIEISGVETLDDAVREAIVQSGEGGDITRVGELFVIGPFPSQQSALKVAEAIEATGAGLSMSVAAIAPAQPQ